jgi:hypothetical protein
MDYSEMSRPIGLPPRKFRLDPEAKQALGRVSPELAALQLRTLVSQVADIYPEETEKLRQKYEYPVDLTNMLEVLGIMDPVRLANQLHYADPKLDLQNLPKQDPLKVLEALLKMFTQSDRYQSCLP